MIYVPGKASVIVGGCFGSEAKGSVAAYFAVQQALCGKPFSITTTNASANAGHTSIHKGTKRVAFHLPTASLIAQSYGFDGATTYLNGGAIINPQVLERELVGFNLQNLFIHPNAAVILPEHIEREQDPAGVQRIASTRKGVGAALADKIMRKGNVASNHPFLQQFVRHIDLNQELLQGRSILVEVPQGIGLGVDGPFYPYCTSRNCTVQQALSDAGIHPSFLGPVVLVMRTYAIRVGNITEKDENGYEHKVGNSGGCYSDQQEITWEELGVEPEYTTVTKRKRRVFTFSTIQAREAMALSRPDVVVLTFCNYLRDKVDVIGLALVIKKIGRELGKEPEILYEYGPTTEDIFESPRDA